MKIEEQPTPVEVAAPEAPDAELGSKVEALLLSVDRPITGLRLAEALGLVPREAEEDADVEAEARSTRAKVDEIARRSAIQRVDRAVEWLNDEYDRSGRAFRVESVAGGYRVLTLPKFAGVIAELHRSRLGQKLTRQAVETLAIVAYKQPITRAQLEAIRGVSCGEVLKSLIERRLVTVKGRAEELGRPLLYGTSKAFLDVFGLASLKDLPTPAELKGSA
ncbi:Segregation and condensation protein B [Phycisphaerales bacterium]|nr:Segregation and condensation protein B [Phycisphaerales bacterium]